jgi:hypothetical protein
MELENMQAQLPPFKSIRFRFGTGSHGTREMLNELCSFKAQQLDIVKVIRASTASIRELPETSTVNR